MSDAAAPANWYDDPENPSLLRYWDGAAWTDHRAPKVPTAPAPQPDGTPALYATQYPYGAQAPYGARVRAPGTPVSPALLMAAGGSLVLAGIGRMLSYLVPYEAYELSLVGSVLEVIGWVGAFVGFFAAGYPSRHTAARVLTGVLIGLYVVSGIVGIAFSFNPFQLGGLTVLVGFLGLCVLGVSIPFSIVSFRTLGLTRGVAVLPLVLYSGLILFGIVSSAANAAAPYSSAGFTIGGLSGLVPATVGVLFVIFGRRPHAAS